FRIAKTVDVIDPKSSYSALADQAKNQLMNGCKNLWLLNADRCEFIDVEEATIVDLVCSDAPERQAVWLLVEILRKEIESRRIAMNAIEFHYSPKKGSADRGA